MTRVRFGIVGLGIGKAMAAAVAQDRRTVVTALCDVDPARMSGAAADLPEPVRRHGDFQALCEDPEVDAVFVGTPNRLHVPVALAALRAGKHVLVVKPLSDSEEAARRLLEAAEASGLAHMMALSTRYGGTVQYLGRLTRRGDIGEIYYGRARSVRRSGIPDWGAHFIQEGGGAFRDMAVHALDAAWWMAGCPEPVSALGVAGAKFGPRGQGYWEYRQVSPEFAAQYACDDYAAGLIRFANGAALQVESFWASHQPEEFQIELFGAEGGLRMDPPTLYHMLDGRPADVQLRPAPQDGFAGVVAHFAACVLDGIPCESPLRHGLIVQRMLEGVLASAASGKEIILT